MNNLKNKTFNIWIVLSICLTIVCVGIFVFLAVRYEMNGNLSMDIAAIEFSKTIRSPFLTGLFKVVTHFGSFLTIGILTAIMAIVIKPLLVKIFAVANIAIVGGFCLVVKYLIKRPRPVDVNLIKETGFSFPSAHAMIAVVFFGFLIFLILRYIKNKSLKITLTILFSVLALIIGYTRVYLGVHYLSDVLAGIVAGIAYLTAAILLYLFLEKKFKKVKNEKV